MSQDRLPAYAESLAVFHRAFEAELREMIGTLPMGPDSAVLDVACGDGFFTRLLAERPPGGRTAGVDLNDEYLRVASDHCPAAEFHKGDASRLQFEDGTFDLVWCAQSLISLPDPEKALAEMVRVTRGGGTVAVMEEDAFHNLILPWPPEREVKIQEAQRRAAEARYDDAGRIYQGRRLTEMLEEAGLDPVEKQTFAWDRRAPLSEADAAFIADYLDSLAGQAGRFMGADLKAEVRALADAWPTADDLEFTYLAMLATGIKPR